MNRFDRAFWKKVWSLLRLYWLSAERLLGVKLLACVAVLAGVGLAIGACVTYLNRDITNALVGKHLPQFYHVMVLAAAAAAVGVLAKVLEEYVGSLLYIEWREWLTHYFVDQGLFTRRAFYRIGLIGKVDNPDQRISDDIGSFVESTEIFNHPRYAFLDEATSTLDVENEQLMYQLLNRQRIPFLSSGHRPTLLRFHRHILQLSPDHNWKVERSLEFEMLNRAA